MSSWFDLPYGEWRETRDTLHMYTQVLGKLRLALSPFEPEWANVPLYLTARGLTTSPMPVGLRTLQADLDLIEHVLVLSNSDGDVDRWPLGSSVADFHKHVVDALARMHVDVAISPVPSEVPDPIPFPEDTQHEIYRPSQAHKYWCVLSMIDVILKRYRAGFRGKTTPVQFFWGSFDLVVTRFSGRAVTPPAGDVIAHYGGDAEQICGGWWPGNDRHPEAAFFAYGYPKHVGLERAVISPAEAAWSADAGEFLLPYKAVRQAPDPESAILSFLRTTYDAAAALMGWRSDLTHVEVPPPHTLSHAGRSATSVR